jgi:hypothetical protein
VPLRKARRECGDPPRRSVGSPHTLGGLQATRPQLIVGPCGRPCTRRMASPSSVLDRLDPEHGDERRLDLLERDHVENAKTSLHSWGYRRLQLNAPLQEGLQALCN